MKEPIIAALLAALLIPVSCLTTSSNGGDPGSPSRPSITSIQNLSDEEFALLLSDVSLIAELGVRRLMRDRADLEEKAVEFVARAKGLIYDGGVHLASFARNLVDEIADENARALVSLVMNRIQAQGGFDFVDSAAGAVLSERGAALIESLIDGASSGIGARR